MTKETIYELLAICIGEACLTVRMNSSEKEKTYLLGYIDGLQTMTDVIIKEIEKTKDD